MFLFVVCSFFILFFFFKQKTAYEMRISDWSSDVCSSDLSARTRRPAAVARAIGTAAILRSAFEGWAHRNASSGALRIGHHTPIATSTSRSSRARRRGRRSEEHTSELQSLMRISYAVFCLKKKKNYKSEINYSYNATNNT